MRTIHLLGGITLSALLMTGATSSEAQELIAPGVEYQQRIDPGPRRVSILRINLCTSGVRMRATASGERGARTSSWAGNTNVVAAVNGGFFLSGARPDNGVAAGNGQEWPDSADSGVRGFLAFGPRQLTHSPAPEVSGLPVWVEEAVNGDATLVQDGQAVNCGGCGGGRAPRTAVGYTADRQNLVMVVVDGRSGSSIGATIDELAVLMASLGVDRAMNLDGGGSSTMWVGGRGVVNRPSDGSERSVANHLGVYSAGSGLRYNCPEGYGAEYVGSGFPGGTTRWVLEQGTTLTGELRFRNAGTFGWNNTTRLAPIPRDQASPLAVDSWISPSRIAAPTGAVAPGEVGTFSFTVRAPDQPGVYRQYINLLQESVSWFANSWGPMDNAFYFEVESTGPPRSRGAIVATGWPDDGIVTLAPGESTSGWIEMRNTGSETWPAELVRFGTTNPRDHASLLYADDWLSQNRAAINSVNVAPGETHRFAFSLQAPESAGRYQESFGIVYEGVRWFSEDGGPADDFLQLTVVVQEPEPEDTRLPDEDTGFPGDTAEALDTTSEDTQTPQNADTAQEDVLMPPDTASIDAEPEDMATETNPFGPEPDALPDTPNADTMEEDNAEIRSGSQSNREGCAAVGSKPASFRLYLMLMLFVLGIVGTRHARSMLTRRVP